MSGGSRILSALALTAVLSVSLAAEETPAPAASPSPAAAPAAEGGSRRDMGRGDRGSRGGRFQEMIESMRAQKPEEAAEIEKLMQTDPRAAMRRAREAFPEIFSGSSRGGFRGGMSSRRDPWQSLMQQLKDKFPEEYAEIEKQMQTDRTGAVAKLRELAAKAGLEVPEGEPGQTRTEASLPSPRNRNREMKKAAERIIRQLYPEDYALMLEMREIDPDAARETFRALVREAGLTMEDLEKTALMQSRRVRSVVFTDKELEEQYEQTNSTGSGGNNGGPWGFPGGNGGGFRGGPPPMRMNR